MYNVNDEAIEEYKYAQKVCELGMEVCIRFLNVKNDRVRNNIKERSNKLKSAELDQLKKLQIKFYNEISKNNQKKFVNHFQVEDVLVQEQKKYRIELTKNDIESMGEFIAEDPASALREYTSKYIESRRMIDFYQKEKLKEQEEAEKQDRYNNQLKYDEVITGEPVPFQGINDEESKRLLDEQIDKMLENGADHFTEEEQNRIKQIYPELNNSDYDYYSPTTLDQGIEIERITNQKNIKIYNIMRMGLLTFEVVTKELVSEKGYSEPSIFNKLNMKNSLEKYEKAYEKYMKYYNSLSPKDKQIANNNVLNNKDYVELLGRSVVTPNYLKTKINEAVSDYIVNNSNSFYKDKRYYTKTLHAAKYMSIDEIVSLYERLRSDKSRDPMYYTRDSEISRRQKEEKEEDLRLLQEDFAHVILKKLGKNHKHVNINNMSEEEQKRLGEIEDEKIAGIIVDILKEYPRKEKLREKASDQEGKGDTLKGTFEAKEEVKSRVTGMSRFKKAIAQLNGQWQRYLMLNDKEELTIEEQEELKGLFK